MCGVDAAVAPLGPTFSVPGLVSAVSSPTSSVIALHGLPSLVVGSLDGGDKGLPEHVKKTTVHDQHL